MNFIRLFRLGLFVGTRDFTLFWNWKTWFGGWMVQILAQATFYSLFARLFDSPEHEQYLLIGNAVAVGVSAVGWTIPSTTWDRWTGVYPLLVIAPASLVPAVMGRTFIWFVSGLATSLVTFFVLGLVFDLDLPWPSTALVVPLVVLTSASTFSFSLFLGAVVLRQSQIRNLLLTLMTMVVRAFCGVSVPIAFWPEYVQFIVKLLPITHGLQAIRLAVDEAPMAAIIQAAALEIAVAMGWIIIAVLAMDRMANAGRKDGSIEFI